MSFLFSKTDSNGRKQTKICGGLIKKVKTPQKKEIFVLGVRVYKKKKIEKKTSLNKSSVNLQELFTQQLTPYGFYNRLDTIVRLLAIENYYSKNDYGWKLYEKMQDARIGQGYAEQATIQFQTLIQSWEEHGYEEHSYILVDKNLKILDGSHRLALALYYNIKKVSIDIEDLEVDNEYGLEWFIENNFTYNEIKLIQDRYEQILRSGKMDNEIACTLWCPVADYFEEITQKLSLIYNIKEIKDYELSDSEYSAIVKAIYSCDDIDDWKIDTKLEYMNDFSSKKIRVIKLSFKNPIYRFKQSNYNTLLTQGEALKRIIRNCYKDKIPNYFYDIIIHTSDNTNQAEFIGKILDVKIDLVDYFDKIKDFNYMIIKYDTPYMTQDFPHTFPFGKDADIICSENDFDELVDFTYKYFNEGYSHECTIIKIDKNKDNSRIRIELLGNLIYQIDISSAIDNIPLNFIQKSLTYKVKNNNTTLAPIEYELVYRVADYIANPNKDHHLEYILANKVYLDKDLVKENIKKGYDNFLKHIEVNEGERG